MTTKKASLHAFINTQCRLLRGDKCNRESHKFSSSLSFTRCCSQHDIYSRRNLTAVLVNLATVSRYCMLHSYKSLRVYTGQKRSVQVPLSHRFSICTVPLGTVLLWNARGQIRKRRSPRRLVQYRSTHRIGKEPIARASYPRISAMSIAGIFTARWALKKTRSDHS